MENLIVTLFTASILGLVLLYLSFKVIFFRRSERVALGDGKDKSKMMYQAVRAHANFTEYVPLSLIILAMLESSGAHDYLLFAVSGCLIVGRVLHMFGLSQSSSVNFGRFYGTLLTFISLLVGAVGGLYLFFMM